MSTEKMRDDFEQFIIRRDGSIWVSVMGDDRSYNEPIERDFAVWCESRAAIEVELPEQRNVPDRDCWARTNALGYNTANHECRKAIESIGLKVKP